MHGIAKKVFMILTGLSLVALPGAYALIHSETPTNLSAADVLGTPILIAHQGSSPRLDRPPVAFDHDRHTTVLKQTGIKDCAICHVLEKADPQLGNQDIRVFTFPKGTYDRTDKKASMLAFHGACVGCHDKMKAEGKQSGPEIGLCGKCHVRKPKTKQVVWAWSPIFNYARHAKHAQATEKRETVDKSSVTKNVQIVGQSTGKKCEACHHLYDAKHKKLIYKKNCENSCSSCHKGEDTKDARSMKHVAHSACIGCHMNVAEKVKKKLLILGRTQLTEKDKKQFGPFECKGCHGEHKKPSPSELVKIPRLERGQKDMMNLSLVSAEKAEAAKTHRSASADEVTARMKVVPFNHKAHEPRAEFCNACHHHSLEKCINCHTPTGSSKKGGGISYERAFHLAGASQACIGCHGTAKKDRQCAGCHHSMTNPMPASSCSICHRGPSEGQVPDERLPLYHDKKEVPETVIIKDLEKEFKPAHLPHLKIVNKLVSISNGSSLARRFHGTGKQTLCAGCHHRSELQSAAVKVPTCATCHTRPFQPNSLGKPGILGAYHQQCIGCHQAMNQKPKALECTKCHPAKEGVRTAQIIPPVDGKQ
jgi:hypothetical protein